MQDPVIIGHSIPAAGSVAGPVQAEAPLAPTPVEAEVGGRDGPDPTRYGDWEKHGRCIDF